MLPTKRSQDDINIFLMKKGSNDDKSKTNLR